MVKRSVSYKIKTPEQASQLRRFGPRRIVFTNGCFDLLHMGHVRFLEQAAQLGDLLVVAVNSDASVRQLKGPTRPVNDQFSRMTVVAALESVDIVFVLDALRCDAMLKTLAPHAWAKGGDYSEETLDPGERAAAHLVGAEIHLLPLLNVRSTTATIEAIAAAR